MNARPKEPSADDFWHALSMEYSLKLFDPPIPPPEVPKKKKRTARPNSAVEKKKNQDQKVELSKRSSQEKELPSSNALFNSGPSACSPRLPSLKINKQVRFDLEANTTHEYESVQLAHNPLLQLWESEAKECFRETRELATVDRWLQGGRGNTVTKRQVGRFEYKSLCEEERKEEIVGESMSKV
jgi:hypothetical protein